MEWQSIKNGLPPVGIPLVVTIHDSFRNRRELRYPVYYRKSAYGESWGFYVYGEEEHILLPEYSEVLAWREFPEIYEGDVEGNPEMEKCTSKECPYYRSNEGCPAANGCGGYENVTEI